MVKHGKIWRRNLNLQPKNKVFFDKELHRYTDEAGKIYPSVTEILSYLKIVDYSSAPQAVRDNALNFGTIFHDTINLLDTDNLKSYDMSLSAWMDGYSKFLTDMNPEYSIIEQPLISRKYGFAGTPDRVYNKVELDIKTGHPAFWHELQLAGYELLLDENYGLKIEKRLGLYIDKDKYTLKKYEKKISVFLGCVNLYHYLKGKNGR